VGGRGPVDGFGGRFGLPNQLHPPAEDLTGWQQGCGRSYWCRGRRRLRRSICGTCWASRGPVEELVGFIVARVLDHLDITHEVGKRWSGE
jgi:hypothetical protein